MVQCLNIFIAKDNGRTVNPIEVIAEIHAFGVDFLFYEGSKNGF